MDSGCTMEMFQVIHMKAPPGPIPDGLKVITLADPNRLDPARSNLALSIGSFTLWPMSYYDNRVSFGMVLYDPRGKVSSVTEKPGARYIAQVTRQGEGHRGAVTFIGQANQSVSLTCEEINQLLLNSGG